VTNIIILSSVNAALIGHLHPLLVHLPIGIFAFAFIISLFGAEKRATLAPALSAAMLSGAIASLLACIAGYLLAQSGEYEAELVLKHQWTGITTCILGFLAYFIVPYRRPLVWATAVVMLVAGHLGGTITHGEDYFFAAGTMETTTEETPLDTVLQAIEGAAKKDSSTKSPLVQREISLYEDQVVPILQNKCYTCHSKIKKKGGLRLDSEKFIKMGGKNGAVLTAGDPDNSKLYTHMILPLEDEDHMPPKGKKQLTAGEISTIHRWVKMGNPFEKTTVETKATTDTEPKKTLQANEVPSMKISPAVAPAISVPDEQNTLETAKTYNPANQIALEAVKKMNVVITPIQTGSNGLSLNFVNIKNFNGNMLDDIAVLKNQVVQLKLTNQQVTDQDLQKIKPFKQLLQLQLEKSKITDEGLEHLRSLTSLEQLNLYGTGITDKGLEVLASCKQLKSLYLWKTNVTEEGIAKLKKALPKLNIEAGGFEFKKPDSIKRQTPS